ncbi:MAG: hypothetical protein R2873_04695 [Caldilineaceae bacterium]
MNQSRLDRGKNERKLDRTAALWLLLAGVGLVGLLAAWIVVADVFPFLRGPGVWPPSWRWLHVPLGGEAWPRLLGHGLLLLGYGAAVIHWTRPRGRVRSALIGAGIFVIVWQLAQSWLRDPNVLDTLIFRTYAPPLNGYFLAPAQVEDIGATLRNYVAAMPAFFGDKPQTHPPGLFLYYALFQVIFEALPGLTGWFAPIARGWANPGQDWVQLSDALITSAFVTTVLQTLAIGATPAAVYAFLRQLCAPDEERSRTLALWGALLTPLIPALTLFYLQWDQLFPAIGFAAWFFALRGQNRLWQVDAEGWGQWLDWLWAGLLLSLLTWISFGTLAFGLMIGLHVLWREAVAFVENRNRFDLWLLLPPVGGLAIMGAGVALPWLAAFLGWGMNFFELMRAGLGAHYDIVTAHRVYATWVWMNVVDYVLWTGPALILLGMAGSALLLTGVSRLRPWRDWAGLALIAWITFILLDVSGATRGEIGRLWIFLMPFPIFIALALPWTRGQRIAVLALMLGWGWVIAYSIPPFLCC